MTHRMATASDAELLVAARAGDEAALDTLIERHQGRIYRFGMKMCRDPDDAQDVLQETLLALARGVRDFRGASSISTWLYTVARSFCIKKRRRSKYAPDLESLDADGTEADTSFLDPSRTPEEALAGRQVEAALERAIGALDPMYREVLILRDVEGLSAPEVAEITGLTVQAVKSRLHRARVAVRNAVAPMLGVPADDSTASGTCPDVLTLFSKHLEDEITADVCRMMERHVEGCARCRNACESLKQTLVLCRTWTSEAEVPRPVQLAVKRALRDFLAEGA